MKIISFNERSYKLKQTKIEGNDANECLVKFAQRQKSPSIVTVIGCIPDDAIFVPPWEGGTPCTAAEVLAEEEIRIKKENQAKIRRLSHNTCWFIFSEYSDIEAPKTRKGMDVSNELVGEGTWHLYYRESYRSWMFVRDTNIDIGQEQWIYHGRVRVNVTIAAIRATEVKTLDTPTQGEQCDQHAAS